MSSKPNASSETEVVALSQEEVKDVVKSGVEVINQAKEQAVVSGAKGPKGDDPKQVAEAFTGLPMGLLIAQPFLEASKGQQVLIEDYLTALDTLALQPDDNGETKDRKTRVVEFNLNRPVQKADGSIETQPIKVTAPMLSLVPIPALLIDEMSVNFEMEVKTQAVVKSETAAKSKAEAGYKGWGFNASLSGEVSSNSSASRSSDTGAKYSISVHASQQPSTEGMNKLASIFASVIEPIPQPKSGLGS